jgi:hypothetical protein
LEHIKLVIDQDALSEYEEHYFSIHKKAKKRPIAHPYHESINVWMIMRRTAMNALKQRWKDFIVWFIEKQGYSNLRIEKCDMSFTAYYPNHRRHDDDNSCPKFILDGLVESGFLVDDDSEHLQTLTLRCLTDVEHPRTEIYVTVKKLEEKKEDNENGKE